MHFNFSIFTDFLSKIWKAISSHSFGSQLFHLSFDLWKLSLKQIILKGSDRLWSKKDPWLRKDRQEKHKMEQCCFYRHIWTSKDNDDPFLQCIRHIWNSAWHLKALQFCKPSSFLSFILGKYCYLMGGKFQGPKGQWLNTQYWPRDTWWEKWLSVFWHLFNHF